jgi:hypothetical protein
MTNASQGAVFNLEMTGKGGGEQVHGMEDQGEIGNEKNAS